MAKRSRGFRQKIIAPRKHKSRAKYSKRLKTAIKRVRHGLAILKRKKVVPKTVEVRAALPSRNLRRLIRKHSAIVEGEATTFAVGNLPAQAIQDLKALGYKAVGKGTNQRLIVPKTQYIRKGKVYERPTTSRAGFQVVKNRLQLDEIEKQVNSAFERLNPGDMVAFEIGSEGGKGGRSYNLYASAPSMLRDLMQYEERGFKIEYLVTLKVSQATQPAYQLNAQHRAEQRVIGSVAYRNRKRQYNRDYRARKKALATGRQPLRSSRGH